MGSLQLDPWLAKFGYLGQRRLIQSLLRRSWFFVPRHAFPREAWIMEELHEQDSCENIGCISSALCWYGFTRYFLTIQSVSSRYSCSNLDRIAMIAESPNGVIGK